MVKVQVARLALGMVAATAACSEPGRSARDAPMNGDGATGLDADLLDSGTPDEGGIDAASSDGGSSEDGSSGDGGALPLAVSEDDLLASPDSATTTIDVRDYFPRPAPGEALITEFAYTDTTDAGNPARAVPYTVQRYERAPDGLSYYLEDYEILATGELKWLDTWVYSSDDRGVLEFYDSAPTWTFSATEHPLDHGLFLSLGVEHRSVSYEDGNDGTHDLNHYSILLQAVKDTVVLPAGLFHEVTVQAESQLKCTTAADCAAVPMVIEESSSVRYRFYFAPGVGIIAQQYFNQDWSRPSTIGFGFLYAVKTCRVTTADHRCP